MYFYNLYGVDTVSEVKLPCKEQTHGKSIGEKLYICISSAPLKVDIKDFKWYGRRSFGSLRSYDIGDGILICLVDYFQIFYSYTKNKIIVFINNYNYYYLIPLYIIGLVMSIFHLYNGKIPLHAAAIEKNNRNIAIVAKKGTGKSSLLWEFINRGYKYVSDDCLPISIYNGEIYSSPSISVDSKLSKNSLFNMNIKFNEEMIVDPESEKYWVSIRPENRSIEDKKLSAIFLLMPTFEHNLTNQIQIKRVSGRESASILLKNTQGLWAISEDYVHQNTDKFLKILQNVPIYTINYYKSFENLPIITGKIEQLIENKDMTLK